ncbi:MAG: hypothetical protein HDT25_02690 [Ruminococcus sp.]|nr:hypothetical protein [Ruminococcus sp.]
MLNEVAKQQLKKAGWYEGRKIDITEQVKFLESLGYEVFDAAKKFMEEYGELDIYDKYLFMGELSQKHHTTCIKDLFYEHPMRGIEKYDIDEEVGQKTIPVAIFSDQVYIFISEDGWLYNDRGLKACNNAELWNDNYGDTSHFILLWDEIAEGKPRKINYSPAHKGREYL